MRNIRINVEYDGTDFAGWQRQSGKIATVQGEIETALGRILQENISLVAAGRTDKGVHAKAQVANFTTASHLELSRIVHSLNSLLPETIRASFPVEESGDFHARFSAKERQYRYFLLEEPSAIYGRFAGCAFGKPDMYIMRNIADSFIGLHDFSAFSRQDRDNEGRFCNVSECEWYRYNRYFVLRISANRFLRSMVRYLVGAMVSAGNGKFPVSEINNMLKTGDFNDMLKPASPNGLFLWEVTY
jgi:tRNA pseudouridine38-40 synthase